MDDNPITVVYRNSFRDYLGFSIYYYVRNPVIWGIFIIILAVGIKPNLGSVLEVAADHSLVYQVILFITLELVPEFIFLFIIITGIVIDSLIKSLHSRHIQCSITLGNGVILNETQYSRGELKWQGVRKIARTKNYIYLFILHHGAICIPRSAFSSTQSWDSFFAECQAKAKAAREAKLLPQIQP